VTAAAAIEPITIKGCAMRGMIAAAQSYKVAPDHPLSPGRPGLGSGALARRLNKPSDAF
jgi:Holliday junction resolvasome RuvABC ATP-dependent DNA helicase subunit